MSARDALEALEKSGKQYMFKVINRSITEAYLGHCQTLLLERFSLFLQRRFIKEVWQGLK